MAFFNNNFERNFFLTIGALIMLGISTGTCGRNNKTGPSHGYRRPIAIICEIEDPSNCKIVREFDGLP